MWKNSIQNPTTQELYRERLKYKIEQNRIEKDDGIEEVRNKLEHNTIQAFAEALGQQKTNITTKKNNKPWFTEETKEAGKRK